MGARLYHTVTGLFTSIDPVTGGNITAYAYPQDPINQYDLDGLKWNWRKIGRWAGIGPGVAGAIACDARIARGLAVGATTGAAAYSARYAGRRMPDTWASPSAEVAGAALTCTSRDIAALDFTVTGFRVLRVGKLPIITEGRESSITDRGEGAGSRMPLSALDLNWPIILFDDDLYPYVAHSLIELDSYLEDSTDEVELMVDASGRAIVVHWNGAEGIAHRSKPVDAESLKCLVEDSFLKHGRGISSPSSGAATSTIVISMASALDAEGRS
ncbi:hypothetical protein JAV76_01580 [Sanguibacter sp. YZGR15]|uniref:RHS repeat-associated core domain-containing protein n=2 Tax=Sanguibacter suaedae TaxID=2795737 RepID=A0A934I3S6_9MICO|nr:hypothetical protein [Sanguibacter suaedae]